MRNLLTLFAALALTVPPAALADEPESTEEIVVTAKRKAKAPTPGIAGAWLAGRRPEILVAIDPKRNPALANRMKEYSVGEPPPMALSGPVRRMCELNGYGGEAKLWKVGTRRNGEKWQLARSMAFGPRPEDVQFYEFRCAGDKLPAIDLVAREWRLSEEERKRLEQLGGTEPEYVEHLGQFVSAMGMPKPSASGLDLLLSSGPNAAKEYVSETFQMARTGRR